MRLIAGKYGIIIMLKYTCSMGGCGLSGSCAQRHHSVIKEAYFSKNSNQYKWERDGYASITPYYTSML